MRFLLTFLFVFLTFFCSSQERFDVFFASNKFDLTKIEKKKITNWIDSNKEVKIVAINGYTDEDGTNQSNDTLAKNRVDFIFNFIKNKIKIRDDFKTRSFGENFLQSKNKAENRKTTIFYILKIDLARENEILGIKPKDIVKSDNKPIVREPRNFPERMSFENPDGTKEEYALNVDFMKSVDNAKKGEKLKIENLNFRINTFIVENESRPKMYELLMVLKANPKLKIEIQGNICCQAKDRLNLSEQRAMAIAKFLEIRFIEKSRILYKGLGGSNPIYSIPEKSEEERAANRRVEILILENE